MECSAYEGALRFLKELGFPVAVASYLLFRLDGLIRKNTDALHGLRRALSDYGVGTRGGPPGQPPSRL
jgi:hypothetical protein